MEHFGENITLLRKKKGFIFLSFRGVEGLNFQKAYAKLAAAIAELYGEHYYLMESDRLNPLEKETFYRIAAKTATPCR